MKEEIRIGLKTKYGTIKAILYIGERYYMMIDKDGSVSLMPESALNFKDIII